MQKSDSAGSNRRRREVGERPSCCLVGGHDALDMVEGQARDNEIFGTPAFDYPVQDRGEGCVERSTRLFGFRFLCDERASASGNQGRLP